MKTTNKTTNKTSKYWENRVAAQDALFNSLEGEVRKKLIKLYNSSARSIKSDIIDLLDSLDKPIEEVRINDLYRNNRYYELLNRVNEELNKLGAAEIKIIEKELIDMYYLTSALVENGLSSKNYNPTFTLSIDSGRQVAERVWCPDGVHWSNRVWKNKAKMQESLEQGLTDCLARGLPKDKLVTEITELTQSQRYMADRLVRTELTHIQNEAAADSYERVGITQYQYIAAIDDRTSKVCKKANGKIFNFKDKKIGVNFPPLHVGCRSTIIPVLD